MTKQPPNLFRPAKPAGESPGVYLDMESREVKADWGPHILAANAWKGRNMGSGGREKGWGDF